MACPKCEWDDVRTPLYTVLLFAAPAVMLFLASQVTSWGVRVSQLDCQWRPDQQAHVASFMVENREKVYKTLNVTTRVKLSPPKGQKWPHRSIHRNYGVRSQVDGLILEPNGTKVSGGQFPSGDLRDYSCKASVKMSNQERFKERPTPEILGAISQPSI